MKGIALTLAFSCSLTPFAAAQWSTPTLVPNVNTSALDYGPSLSFDGLTLYYSSTAQTGGDIYRATRTSRYGTFGTPVHVAELASAQEDWMSCTRADDIEIFFTSQRTGGGGGGYDIWRAERPSPSAPFNPPVPVTELNTSAADYSPSLTLDGLRVYFSSSRPGGSGSIDIWTATRPNWLSPFGTATPVTELNTSNGDRDPRISPDNLVMFFTSDRPGGAGGPDIWMASRADTSSPFGNIVNLSVLNSNVIEFTPAITLLHDEIFYSSSRPGGVGGWEIYSSRFTGVTSSGMASANSVQSLRFSDPSSPNHFYLAMSSLGTSPGIPIDTRRLPLNFDGLLQISIGGVPPILAGYAATLDQSGVGAGQINFVGLPWFTGFRFYTGFVVLDPAAPSGIKTISNANLTIVQ